MRDQSPARRRHGYPGDQARGGRWRHLSAVRKAAYGCSAFLSVIVVVASLGAYVVYRHLTGNIKVVSVTGLTHRSVYGAQNILLLGSQTRKGQGKGFGSNPSLNTSNSDNLLLVHLDPTHTHALIVSIPRDTIVYEPGCKARPGIGVGYDVTGVANAAPTSTTTVTYSGTAQADSAYTLMTSLKASPAVQDLLAGPARQTGTAGPVTLVLGSDFAGVKPPPAPPAGKPGHGKPRGAGHPGSSASGGAGYGSPTFVQSRNAGSSICSGLPASNHNSGSPP
jgi:hypothetical protein